MAIAPDTTTAEAAELPIPDSARRRQRQTRAIVRVMRPKHGGRRSRARGQAKVYGDFALLAAVVNLTRLACLV